MAEQFTNEQNNLIALDVRLTACLRAYNQESEPSQQDLANALASMSDLIGSDSLSPVQLQRLAGYMFYVSGLVPESIN